MVTAHHQWSSPVQHPSALLDLQDLKHRVDCREVVRLLWGQPKRSTPQRDTYLSRWRDDGRKASFSVTAYGYRDFGGIGEQGSVLDFLQRELNLTFAQSIKWLQDYTHSQPLPITPRPHAERPIANQSPTSIWQQVAEAFVAEGEHQLWLREDILNYLRRERLLSDATIQNARLGWNPRARKIDNKYWIEAGIIIPRYQDGKLWLVNIRTVTGSFADYLGIAPYTRHGETLDKYLCMAGSKLAGTLFNGDHLTADQPILFVEGELDCILAQQEIGHLVTPVTLGGATNRLSHERKQHLLDLNVPIYLALDNDEAGKGAAQYLIGDLGERTSVLKYPHGYKDFTDCLNAGLDATLWFKAQTSATVFPDGPPVTWVSAMMSYMRPGAALLFVASQHAARLGAIDPESFTAPDLLHWMHQNGYPIALPTFYRYFTTCEGELFSKCDLSSYVDIGKDNVLQNENKSRGRPAEAYRLVDLSYVEQTTCQQAWARLYDRAFATDGKTGIKGRPRVAVLQRLGIANAESVAADLDKAYQPIYKRQGNAYRKAEKRIEQALTALKIELADRVPLKITGQIVRRQSDLEVCVIRTRLKEHEPTSQKEIGRWIGKNRSRVGVVLAKAGYQGQEQPRRVIPVKQGQNIKQAAHAAVSNGRWCGLLIDGEPELQPFEQEVADNAIKSVALVIQPPYAYRNVGRPLGLPEKPTKVRKKPIKVQSSKVASLYQPAPYWGNEVNPEVEHNQLVLGLVLSGWIYEAQTACWTHLMHGKSGCSLIEAIQLQAELFDKPILMKPIPQSVT